MRKPVYITDIKQRSPEWFNLRCGILTSSDFDSVVKADGKPAAYSVQTTLIAKKICEAKGLDKRTFSTAAMENGVEWEPAAVASYELDRGVLAHHVGFVFGDESRTWGCSPDCLVDLFGGAETKVLETKAQVVAWRLQEKAGRRKVGIPTDKIVQVYGNLFTTQRSWWDWYAYSHVCPVLARVYRGNSDYVKWAEAFEKTLPKFLAELNAAREAFGLPRLGEKQKESKVFA